MEKKMKELLKKGSVKNCMKKECCKLTGNISDLGLWKCGKGKAFTHIPTHIIILFLKKFRH